MKALICYNPFSGKQKFEKYLNYVTKKLKTKYEEIQVFRSLYEKSITAYITNFASYYDLVIVAGGDGSLNEAINGFMNLEVRPVLAYIPVGTVNDVGNSLKLKKNIKGIVRIILNGKAVKIDVGKIENRYFLYGCGIGKFTNVSYDAPKTLKKRYGRLAYFIEAAKHLKDNEKMNLKIEVDGEEISEDFYVVLILNGTRIAGFNPRRKIKPKFNDGIFDLTLVSKAILRLSLYNLLFFFIFGEKYKIGIRNLRINKCKITSEEEIAYNVDGEFAFSKKEVTIEVVRRAISVVVNKKTMRKYFLKG